MAGSKFKIENKIKGCLGRSGVVETPHGRILTPAFVAVGTQATVKSLSPEQVASAKVDVVLSNTYHLYLKPGHEIIKKAGGIHKFMNWNFPTMTDSGGFQVFSLGAAYNRKTGKIVKSVSENSSKKLAEKSEVTEIQNMSLVDIDEDGVNFKSVVDGSMHRFTPERSIEIEHAIGADIIFAFDECPSPTASAEYQDSSLLRTLRWGERCLNFHKKNGTGEQQLFGIIQGGRIEELRRKSAKLSRELDFDGFGIGGSFDKEDIGNAVRFVNEELPEEKPRHLLGIGEPADLILAIENGCDTFDCVAPTRMARNGSMYSRSGRVNILNAKFKNDFSPVEEGCECYTCKNYSRAYVAHLFRSKEMFAATLASIHNLFYISNLVRSARNAILENNFAEFKKSFFAGE